MAGLEQMDENDVSFMILVVDKPAHGHCGSDSLNVVCEHGFVFGVRVGVFFSIDAELSYH